MRLGTLILAGWVVSVAVQIPSAVSREAGDVDGDFDVDGTDLQLVLDHLLGNLQLGGDFLTRADCTDAAGVDAADLVWILNNTHEHIPGMTYVPGGTFLMGDADGEEHERPVHPVTLSSFYISINELTTREFCNWMSQIAIRQADDGTITLNNEFQVCESMDSDPASLVDFVTSGGGIPTFDLVPRIRDGQDMGPHPMLLVTWHGAALYCNVLSNASGLSTPYDRENGWTTDFTSPGYRLPTEAEWEYAAAWQRRQGGRHWEYGFQSDTIDATRANFNPPEGYANPFQHLAFPFTAPVGSFDGDFIPRGPTSDSFSPFGCYDMSGNIAEWVNDWYDSDYYSVSPAVDPTGPATGQFKGYRGGSWRDPEAYCTTSERGLEFAEFTRDYIGFRMVRRP